MQINGNQWKSHRFFLFFLTFSELFSLKRLLRHEKLGDYFLYVDEAEVIFCENDTNDARAAGGALSPYKAQVASQESMSLLEIYSI